MFRRLADKFNRFMYGKYGADQLFYTMLVIFAVLGIVNNFVHSYIILGIAYAVAILAFLRYFSKNIYKRREENRKFLDAFAAVKNFFILTRDRFRDIKTYRYRKCKYCRSVLRLPIKRGTHTVNCPRCHKRFDVHILF